MKRAPELPDFDTVLRTDDAEGLARLLDAGVTLPDSGDGVARDAARVGAVQCLALLIKRDYAAPSSIPASHLSNPLIDTHWALIEVLMTAGYDPNASDGFLLADCAIRGNAAFARRLFEAGATPDRVRFGNRTTLPLDAEHRAAPRLQQWYQQWCASKLTQTIDAAGAGQGGDDPEDGVESSGLAL